MYFWQTQVEKFWDYKTPKPHKIKYSQMVKITDHGLSMRTRVYSSKRLQHLFFFLWLSFSLYRSFHPLVHDYVWGLHWDLQMFCVWNLGKRSQRRLQMGAAILGNWISSCGEAWILWRSGNIRPGGFVSWNERMQIPAIVLHYCKRYTNKSDVYLIPLFSLSSCKYTVNSQCV